MATILDAIVETKWKEIAASRSQTPAIELERRVADLPPVRDFAAALRVPGEVRIIAEVKKASPSAGIIRADFDAVAIAKIYEAHGAACVSVLTDEVYFQGHLSFLTQARAAIRIPALRKEFILDRYQLLEARDAGADAVLLIAEILPGPRIRELHDEATALGLHVLVELHDAEELNRVLDSGAQLVGINNRDLRSFHTRLSHTLDLMKHVPPSVTLVSESGIRNRDDMKLLAAAGVHAVLVGESLMRSPDIGNALDALRGVS